MPKRSHTPTPWTQIYTTNERDAFNVGLPDDDACGKPVYIARMIRSAADMDRIVHCVNACEGMQDPAAEIAALRQQLRELQEAACLVVADIKDGSVENVDLGEWMMGVAENLDVHLPVGMLAETLKAREEE